MLFEQKKQKTNFFYWCTSCAQWLQWPWGYFSLEFILRNPGSYVFLPATVLTEAIEIESGAFLRRTSSHLNIWQWGSELLALGKNQPSQWFIHFFESTDSFSVFSTWISVEVAYGKFVAKSPVRGQKVLQILSIPFVCFVSVFLPSTSSRITSGWFRVVALTRSGRAFRPCSSFFISPHLTLLCRDVDLLPAQSRCFLANQFLPSPSGCSPRLGSSCSSSPSETFHIPASCSALVSTLNSG